MITAALLLGSAWIQSAYAQLVPATVGTPGLPGTSANGGNIGIPGAPGTWPALATPAGHPFVSAPGNPFQPAAGSLTELEVFLGKALFWDEQLSTDNTTSCGTCHFTENGGVDPRSQGLEPVVLGRGSFGVLPQNAISAYTATTPTPPTGQERRSTKIMAPTMIGAAFANRLFWDGRAGPEFKDTNLAATISGFSTNAALEAQAVMPPIDTREMGHDGIAWSAGQIQAKLNGARLLDLATFITVPPELQPFVAAGVTYSTAFDFVFAGHLQFGGLVGVTRERVALAIASYERTLVPNQAPIDTRPLTTGPGSERNGFDTFVRSSCFRCHAHQPTFFGTRVPVLTGTGGFVDPMDAMLTDNWRHAAINFPGLPGSTLEGSGNFNVKTPSLRNIALHPRFGHNGFFTSLPDVLSFYNRQHPAGTPTFPLISLSQPANTPLTPLELSEVTVFLQALVDPRVAGKLPPFDRPDLYAERVAHESNEPATHFGTPATPGGLTPNIIANIPLQNNDAEFQLGVRNAPPLAAAVLAFSPNPLPVPAPAGPIKINTTGMITVSATTSASGHANFPFGLVTNVVPGQVFSAQWAVVDPVSGNLAFSNAATFTVQ